MSTFQKFMCLIGLMFLSSCVTQGGFSVRNDNLLARLSDSAIDFFEKNNRWPANTDEMNVYNLKSEFYIGQEKIRTIELSRPLTGNYEIDVTFVDERVKQAQEPHWMIGVAVKKNGDKYWFNVNEYNNTPISTPKWVRRLNKQVDESLWFTRERQGGGLNDDSF